MRAYMKQIKAKGNVVKWLVNQYPGKGTYLRHSECRLEPCMHNIGDAMLGNRGGSQSQDTENLCLERELDRRYENVNSRSVNGCMSVLLVRGKWYLTFNKRTKELDPCSSGWLKSRVWCACLKNVAIEKYDGVLCRIRSSGLLMQRKAGKIDAE